MCSFIVTNKNIENLDTVNFYSQKRGPDNTSIQKVNNITFVHNLLSITGEFTTQPIFKNGIYLVFNGEIYNYLELGNYTSDGECILDSYLSDDINGLRSIDGEFAFCLFDTIKNKIIFGVDCFSTKPCYYSFQNDEFAIATYKSNLEALNLNEIIKVPTNTIIEYDLNTEHKIEHNYYRFNLNQYKTSFDDWCIAFDSSIKKRFNSKLDILVPMSSGYDSGAICCSLNKQNLNYISYSIIGAENQNILNQRLNLNTNKIKYKSNIVNDKESVLKKINTTVEKFYYGPTPYVNTHNGHDDPGAIGLYYILNEIKNKHNIKIIFSGQGSDEIMGNISSYGFKTSNPKNFPKNLDSIFPYGNFYYGAQSSYLIKEECIAGSLGIETGYPFLDKKVVQEFLNLSSDLKNLNYKSPLDYYFTVNNYPFAKNEKKGFQI